MLNLTKNDTVVIACNTAHLLQDDIENALNISISSLIEATVNAVQKNNIKIIGLLASPTTNSSGLYHKAFHEKSIQVVKLNPSNQHAIEQVIRHVIAMKVAPNDINIVKLMHKKLLSAGAETVILGCTELSTLPLGRLSRTVDPLQEITSVIMPLNQKNNV